MREEPTIIHFFQKERKVRKGHLDNLYINILFSRPHAFIRDHVGKGFEGTSKQETGMSHSSLSSFLLLTEYSQGLGLQF